MIKTKNNVDKVLENIVADLQIKMVMGMLEQGLVNEAENKLKEFGVSKKEINKIFNDFLKLQMEREKK
tara:strand:+ start:21 stop:224 length:204 start_codon:yes stop_codon:yes gene_type:complete